MGRETITAVVCALVISMSLTVPAWGASGATTGSLPPAQTGPAPSLDLRSSATPGSAWVQTTLAGALFGVADWWALHRLDHPVAQHTGGILGVAKTPVFPAELIGGTALAALWTGGDTRLGRTLWQGLDGAALAGVSTYTLKYTFGRERPSQTTNSDQWFQGTHAQSFPSGDVSSITGLVTPAILEYRRTDPAVYLLAALPVFDMVARVEAQGHWQTDVVGGALVGALSGYYAHHFAHPLFLSLMPHGIQVGLSQRF